VSSCRRRTSNSRNRESIWKYDARTRAPAHSHEIIVRFFFSTTCSFFFGYRLFFRVSSHEVSNHSRVVVTVILELGLGLTLLLRLSSLLDHRVAGNGGVIKHLFDLTGIATTLGRQLSEEGSEEFRDIVRTLSVVKNFSHLLSECNVVGLSRELSG